MITGVFQRGLRRPWLSLLCLITLGGLGLLIWLALQLQTTPRPVFPGSPIPVGLKNTFMLGLSNGPGELDWMTESAIPWDMRTQFLVGDVTANPNDPAYGWAGWNQPSGAFAGLYMNASLVNNYFPVLTYYTMYYTSPGKNEVNEAQRSLVNLRSSATMQAYFTNFKLLMDLSKAFGKPVIIHVEPDFWGFTQQNSRANNPASVTASIASSGFGDVTTDKPDNLIGFAQTLVALRDKYAPNVILAYHNSVWGTGIDLATSTDPNLDVNRAIELSSQFYNTLQAKFDLIFFDVADRDAGFRATGDDKTKQHWWDITNKLFPNFERYRTYLAGVTQRTNTRAMLSGVPMGNRIYRTMNNSPQHYQDNRVEFFLGPDYQAHLQAYIRAGLVGILFEDGEGTQTTYRDRAKDGLTNPAPINGNTLSATVSDDDGGYLRERGRNYYLNGPLPTSYLPAVLTR